MSLSFFFLIFDSNFLCSPPSISKRAFIPNNIVRGTTYADHGRTTFTTLSAAGYPRSAIPDIITSRFPRAAAKNFTLTIAFVRDVMGRRVEDINPHYVFFRSLRAHVAPRYTALHKVYVRCGVGPWWWGIVMMGMGFFTPWDRATIAGP
jgi:hypothetical protein